MPGAKADALFAIDDIAHRSRQGEGVGAVTRLSVLHEHLTRAPSTDGFIDGLESGLRPVGWVTQVEVHSPNPGAALRAATLFRAVAPTVVVTGWPRNGLADLVLEASALSVGLVIDVDSVRETLVEADFTPGVFDAATWAFHERAYAVWLRAERVPEPGRRVRPAA